MLGKKLEATEKLLRVGRQDNSDVRIGEKVARPSRPEIGGQRGGEVL